MRDLAVFSAGFLRQAWLRDALRATGWRVRVGIEPGKTQAVGVWGRRPVSARGIAAAARHGLPLLTVEDGFLRSVLPGRREPAVSLLLDDVGVHFDASAPSRLEGILAHAPLNDSALLARARDGRALLAQARLSKYNAYADTPGPLPQGFVLVVDQSRGDASITHGGAGRRSFARMLDAARAAHPDAPVLLRRHPAARQGHFTEQDLDTRTQFAPAQANPIDLLREAAAVYTVTSQMGFEAILLGHRPRVFGQPFYAGWGLSDDEQPLARRTRALSVDQLFAGAMLCYPLWFDPNLGREVTFERAVEGLLARRKLWQVRAPGLVVLGARAWKQPHLGKVLAKPHIARDPEEALCLAAEGGRDLVAWASSMPPDLPQRAQAKGVRLWRMEDGFLRSVGLGAELRPPASMVLDDAGVYFDPRQPSRLDGLIAQSVALDAAALARARALRTALVDRGVSKYNLAPGAAMALPKQGGRTVLVVGQVADDASVRLGGAAGIDNAALLARARAAHPQARLIYKPHPDVEAGLRPGAIRAEAADIVACHQPILPLIAAADRVWTLSSLAGFEALLRGVPVTCLGAPFYAGWGLTEDLGPPVPHRQARPSLDQMVHAVLIDYPHYVHPQTGLAMSVETAVEILGEPTLFARKRKVAGLALAQRRLAWLSPLWRGAKR